MALLLCKENNEVLPRLSLHWKINQCTASFTENVLKKVELNQTVT